MIRVLVVEDGYEYIESLQRFLTDGFFLQRVGDGFAALQALAQESWDVVLLDMCFDRSERLMGEEPTLLTRMGGDIDRVRAHLEIHQGTFILAAIRGQGHHQPVVFSYDFDTEPRRFANLQKRYAPLAYVNDVAGPREYRAALKNPK